MFLEVWQFIKDAYNGLVGNFGPNSAFLKLIDEIAALELRIRALEEAVNKKSSDKTPVTTLPTPVEKEPKIK